MLQNGTIRDWKGNVLTLGNLRTRAALTDPYTPYLVQPMGQTGYGDPVFSDEFQVGTLHSKWIPWYPDTAFWNATVPGGHQTNSNEPQGYDASGITFDADGMVLTYRAGNDAVPELDYTSGMVCSYESFNQLYGYFEARMLLANVEGAWPAFWLMPQDMVWPPEIDIMENFAKGSFNTKTDHTFHYPNPPGGAPNGTQHEYGVDVGNAWHVFGARWEPGRIRWYVDGVQVKDLTIDPSLADGPMYMICNLAGNKDNVPDPGVVPFSVKVSHIRAWALPS